MDMTFQGNINQICIRHSLIKINVLDCYDEWTKILLGSGYRTICLDIIHNSVVNGQFYFVLLFIIFLYFHTQKSIHLQKSLLNFLKYKSYKVVKFGSIVLESLFFDRLGKLSVVLCVQKQIDIWSVSLQKTKCLFFLI